MLGYFTPPHRPATPPAAAQIIRGAIARARALVGASPIIGVYCLAVVAAMALPFVFGIVLLASVSADDYGAKHSVHVGLNVLANLICLAIILSTRGTFQHRLTSAMVGVFVNFGVLLLIILAFRLYYSRPLLIASFFAAIALVSVFNLLLEWYQKRRIGLVPQGIDGQLLGLVGSDASLIRSPDEQVRAYDVVLVNWPMVTDPKWLQFATHATLSGCEVHHVAAYIEKTQGRVLTDHFESDHAGPPRRSLYIKWYKRAFDIVLVLAVAPVALLILALACAAIALTMGRPVFFTQSRTGSEGRSFTMYKLRTMRAAHGGAPASATVKNDPRITPLGKFLRRLRIDEIPQFYNILIGDMSLVGPRPEQPDLARAYERNLPAFAHRTMVRPGITGWAQVRGRYAADEAETVQKLEYDLYYLKHASLAMDISILARTIRTLATGNSAR